MNQINEDANNEQAVVIYSGGMDSFTVLNACLEEHGGWYKPHNVHALSVHYGQRHSRELDMAQKYCMMKGINHQLVDIQGINSLLQGSALTTPVMEVPEGHYAAPNMVQTVVPNRNMILLSLAIAFAVSQDSRVVYYGAHSGDHDIYPDCRPVFLDAMNQVAAVANYETITIEAPFLHGDKKTILEWGYAHGLDYSLTWTCYNGRDVPCGKCGACVERAEAFEHIGRPDPLLQALEKEGPYLGQ